MSNLNTTPYSKLPFPFANIAKRAVGDFIALLVLPIGISTRRTLAGNRWEAWIHLVRRLMDVHLSQQPDQLR